MTRRNRIDPSYVPRRGDMIYLDFDPQAGIEQAMWRPALRMMSWNPYSIWSRTYYRCRNFRATGMVVGGKP
jgi:hypothetical protein